MSGSERPARSRRWQFPLLMASLAVNLLVAGAVGGWFASKGPPGRDRDQFPGSARSVMGEPFVRALPQVERDAVAEALKDELPRLRENRVALRSRFEALLSALTAEKFDADAFRLLLAEQRSVALRRQEIGEAILIDRLQAMSLQERTDYAERLARGLRNLRRN